jgi:vacuolar iron transporter family protein
MDVQTEIDAGYLYAVLAKREPNPQIAKIFEEMSAIEYGHARAFWEKHVQRTNKTLPGPSGRAKVLDRIGRYFGDDYVLGVLLDTEKRLAHTVAQARKAHGSEASFSDAAHVAIVDSLMASRPALDGGTIARFEKRHRSVGGNALRAAVLGGNDGLVSNFSLIMGVAGATNGQKEVLLAGMAGLLAGALSMAMGEWISVKSSQELYEHQMSLEMDELEHDPEGEKKELALLYRARGYSDEQAQTMATETMKDKSAAHALLVKEELGIDPAALEGSPREAALASFVLFAIGAIIPLFPFFFATGNVAILCSAGLSMLGLFGIGALITLFTGRSIWASGMRQVVFGAAAAAITYAIGRMVGIAM